MTIPRIILDRVMRAQRHADKSLIRRANTLRSVLRGLKKLRGKAEMHRFVFALQLEAHHCM
jgi:hypothetical protein